MAQINELLKGDCFKEYNFICSICGKENIKKGSFHQAQNEIIACSECFFNNNLAHVFGYIVCHKLNNYEPEPDK